jgi:hypothetical protein
MSVISNEDTEYAAPYVDRNHRCSICDGPLSYPFVAWKTADGFSAVQICGGCCGDIKDELTADLNLTVSLIELREREAEARSFKRKAAERAKYRHTIIRFERDLPHLLVWTEDGNRIARKIITEICGYYGQEPAQRCAACAHELRHAPGTFAIVYHHDNPRAPHKVYGFCRDCETNTDDELLTASSKQFHDRYHWRPPVYTHLVLWSFQKTLQSHSD